MNPTEKQFHEELKKITDKRLGFDYGFIAGTETPYIYDGFQSSTLSEGFIVWKREPVDGVSYKQITLHNEGFEKNIENIKNFLNS